MELSILFLPLIASIISGFFGRYIGDRNSEIVTSALVSISAILSIIVLYQVIINQYEENIVIATWINSGSLDVNWSMLIDPLSADRGSINIDQLTSSEPELIQVAITIFSSYWLMITWYKTIIDKIADIETNALVTISEFLSPM